jgi:site-specific DNA recombinase
LKSCVIYARVSSRDQADHGTSLDTQTDACRAYALQQGYTIVREIAEDASGATLQRPGLDEVRELARAGAVDAVVFYHLDRLSRDDTNTLLLARELTQQGVALDCATMRIEDTPTGKFLFSVLAAQAALERAMILERTQRGKVRAAQNGKVLASIYTSYGYRYVAGEGRLEVYEPEACWVRQIFEWVAREGLSGNAVAQRLRELDVPTRARAKQGWWPATVARMISNPVYKGEHIWNKRRRTGQGGRKGKRDRSEWVTIAVPAVVSAELWEEAQLVVQRHRKHQKRHVLYQYLLRRMIVCSGCGYRLIGRTSITQAERMYHYYACPTRRQHRAGVRANSCGQPPIRADRAASEVWSEVIRQLCTEGIVEAWLAANTGSTDGDTRRQVEDLRILSGKEAQLDREADNLLDLYQPGDIDRTTYLERMEGIKKRREALRKERAQLQAARDRAVRESTPVRDWLSVAYDLRERLPHMDYEAQRAFLMNMDITLYADGRALTVHGLPEVVTLFVD